MSLWNNIKDWFDKEEPQQKPEQPAGEAAQVVEERSIEELFLEVCVDIGIGSKILNQTQATEKFVAWYEGPADTESIKKSLVNFVKTDMAINSKFIRAMKRLKV